MRPIDFCRAGVCRRGFTLVELLVVVMLLGVLAGVAAPRYAAAVAGIELEATAKQMADYLRCARREAIRCSTSVEVLFDPMTGSYGTPDDDDTSAASGSSGRGKKLGHFKRYESRLESANFDGAQRLIFDFRGQPSSPGAVTLEEGGKSYTVRVDALGGVTVE